MALTNCPECGNQVSTSAKSCPHCGYAGKSSKNSSGCMHVAGVVIIGLIIIFVADYAISDLSRNFRKKKRKKSTEWLQESIQEGMANIAVWDTITLENCEVIILSEKFDNSNSKATIQVQLSKRVKLEELKTIADSVKDRRPSYSKQYIFYVINGTNAQEGAGAWAISHFYPEPEIKILGETESQLNEIESKTPQKGVIGKWKDNSTIGGVITILTRSGKFYFYQIHKDGSSLERQITKDTGSNGETIYRYVDKKYNDYVIVKSNGRLEFHDNYGLIYSCVKIE